jgi:hypothetical protein
MEVVRKLCFSNNSTVYRKKKFYAIYPYVYALSGDKIGRRRKEENGGGKRKILWRRLTDKTKHFPETLQKLCRPCFFRYRFPAAAAKKALIYSINQCIL